MNGLIRASLKNPYAVTVMCLSVLVIGVLTLYRIPIDILPVFRSPAVQVMTFYGGMPAEGIEKDVTGRIERWTNQANGVARQEIPASLMRLQRRHRAETSFKATLTRTGRSRKSIHWRSRRCRPAMPPGTLPPVVFPL